MATLREGRNPSRGRDRASPPFSLLRPATAAAALALCALCARPYPGFAQQAVPSVSPGRPGWLHDSALRPDTVHPTRYLERWTEGRGPGNPVARAALWTGLLGVVPGVAVGAAVDRWVLGDPHSEDPGFEGAIVGAALGFGLGGILGAHHASGGKGDIRIPLGALGVAAAVMALDVEAGYAATAAAVSVAIVIES